MGVGYVRGGVRDLKGGGGGVTASLYSEAPFVSAQLFAPTRLVLNFTGEKLHKGMCSLVYRFDLKLQLFPVPSGFITEK